MARASGGVADVSGRFSAWQILLDPDGQYLRLEKYK